MKNDNAPKPDSSSILTPSDLNAAIELVGNGTTDPLAQFPPLQILAVQLCDATVLEFVLNDVPVDLAKRAAARMYALGAVAALAVRNACLGGFLPDTDADLA
jgi:hypothetical protein